MLSPLSHNMEERSPLGHFHSLKSPGTCSSATSTSVLPAAANHQQLQTRDARIGEKLWQAITAMRELAATLEQSPSTPASSFHSSLLTAVHSSRGPLASFLIESLHTREAAGLRAQWTAHADRRELVRSITEESRREAQKQQEGLKQIKACLTAQLAKQVAVLKTRVQEHKLNSSFSSPVSSPQRSHPVSPPTLPPALIQLHERCMAVHRDIQVIDAQLESLRGKVERMDCWVKVEEKHVETLKSPIGGRLTSQPPSASSHAVSSRFSTPASLNSSASEGAPTPSSTASSASNFSHTSTPSRHHDHSDGQAHMQQLLFSPILPASSGSSPVSNHETTSPSSGGSSAGVESLEMSALDTLFSKIWSGSPSAKECEQKEDDPAVSSEIPFSIFVTPAEEAHDSPLPAAPVTPLRRTTPSSTRSHKRRGHCSSSPSPAAPLTEVDSSCSAAADDSTPAMSSPYKLSDSPMIAASPIRAPKSPEQVRRETGEWYLERAREIADNMQHARKHASPGGDRSIAVMATAVDPLTPSSLISMAASSPFATMNASNPNESGAVDTSKQAEAVPIDMNTSNVATLKSPQTTAVNTSKHAELVATEMEGVSEHLLKDLDTPFHAIHPSSRVHSSHTGVEEETAASEAVESELALLLRAQSSKHARHAWMRQMARENADVERLYDATEEAEVEQENDQASRREDHLVTPPRSLARSSLATPSFQSTTKTPRPTPEETRRAETSFAAQSPASERPEQAVVERVQAEEKEESVDVVTPVCSRPRSSGWAQSFHMGSNLQLKQLVTHLATAAVASPSPYKSSASELMKKVQRMNEMMKVERAEQQTTTATTTEQQDTSAFETEWFAVAPAAPSIQRTPLQDVTNHQNRSHSTEVEFDDADFLDDGENSEASTISASNQSSIPSSPLRYSVFAPTVVIKRASEPAPASAESILSEKENVPSSNREVVSMAKSVLARMPAVTAPTTKRPSSAVKAQPLKTPRVSAVSASGSNGVQARPKSNGSMIMSASGSKKKLIAGKPILK
jgi:hypothetical protein